MIIKAPDAYYLFCTGRGILMRKSVDLINWEIGFPPSVFGQQPAWAREKIPNQNDIWASDISYFNDRYHLYYAVSIFGSNKSVIGLATNTTANPKEDSYKWVDEGLVVESTGAEDYNCIDPNLIIDADGVPWLAFGSFWSGIKMRRLDYATGKPSEEDTTCTHWRGPGHNAILRDGDVDYIIYHAYDTERQAAPAPRIASTSIRSIVSAISIFGWLRVSLISIK